MNRNAELATAALGGYVLGRTKKGKAAIRLAMWLSGDQGQQVVAFTKNGITTLIASEAGQQLIGSVREQAQNRTKALTSGLTDNLNERTKSLGSLSVVGKAKDEAKPEAEDDDGKQQKQDKQRKSQQDVSDVGEEEEQEPQEVQDSSDEEGNDDEEEDRRAELEDMGIRALRSVAKQYYEVADLRNATKEDLIDYILQAEEEDDEDEEASNG